MDDVEDLRPDLTTKRMTAYGENHRRLHDIFTYGTSERLVKITHVLVRAGKICRVRYIICKHFNGQ